MGQLADREPAPGRLDHVRKGARRLIRTLALDPARLAQLERDLAGYPAPVLELLRRYGLQVFVLRAGQSLADLGEPAGLSEEAYGQALDRAASISHELVAATEGLEAGSLEQAMAEHRARSELRTNLVPRLRSEGLEFRLASASQPFAAPGAGEEFARLNRHLARWRDGSWHALHELVLLPYARFQGRPVGEARLRDALETTSEKVERSLGVHRFDDRQVILHERFLPDPAPEIGAYRIVVHEVAHALDRVLESLETGERHRKVVHVLYQNARARPELFISSRSGDDRREFFAEAVERFLRAPEELRDPELAAYLQEVMEAPYGDTARFAPPRFDPLARWKRETEPIERLS